MSLKFPNARLLIYDLLNNGGLSGPQSIIKGALDFGLISEQSAKELANIDHNQSCQCLDVTKEVLEKYIERRNNQSNSPPIDGAEIWFNLQRETQKYQESATLTPTGCDSETIRHDCQSLAPAVFDLLLQQINRYP